MNKQEEAARWQEEKARWEKADYLIGQDLKKRDEQIDHLVTFDYIGKLNEIARETQTNIIFVQSRVLQAKNALIKAMHEAVEFYGNKLARKFANCECIIVLTAEEQTGDSEATA